MRSDSSSKDRPRTSRVATTAMACVCLIQGALAQAESVAPLDAQASDPQVMGWMVGAPPPNDKVVSFADDSWFQFPQTRWSLSNIRQVMPTRVVARGSGPPSVFPRAERSDIDAVTFTPIDSNQSMTWKQSLAVNYTDGILILHRGRIVYERYFGALGPNRQHIAMSATKSFVSTIAGQMIHEGALDPDATVAHYLPAMFGSPGFTAM